jgi:hypothetical protein
MEALARVEPGFETIEVAEDPNGLAFSEALYIADARSGAIVHLSATPRRVATIERGGLVTSSRVGGLVRARDGSLFVTRVGFGGAGAVFRIERDGKKTMLTGLSPEGWRIGLAIAGHTLYATQYFKALAGPHDGSIIAIDLRDGSVATWLDGFVKPIGIAHLGHAAVVTDAKQRVVFLVDIEDGNAVACRPLATHLCRPDSVCAFDRESVLVTAYDDTARRGSVYRVWLDGRTREVAGGPWEPRGVATDGERAFVSSRKGGAVLVIPI